MTSLYPTYAYLSLAATWAANIHGMMSFGDQKSEKDQMFTLGGKDAKG